MRVHGQIEISCNCVHSVNGNFFPIIRYMSRGIILVTAAIFCSTALHGCTKELTCKVEMGTSYIQFRQAQLQSSLWRIDAIVCDGYASTLVLDPEDYFSGSCSTLKDTDVETYWKFRMGMLCYSDYLGLLTAKANTVMTSSFDLYTTR